jgi:DNA-binding MarR family transcriptional regulator
MVVDDSKNEDARALIEKIKCIDYIMHRRLIREMNLGEKPGHLFLLAKLRSSAKRNAEGLRVSDLASAFEITASSITQMVTGLEERGYVRRSMDPDDRRAVRVFLTEEGERLADSTAASVDRVFVGLVEHLGKEKSAQLLDLLTDVTEYFDVLKKRHETN